MPPSQNGMLRLIMMYYVNLGCCKSLIPLQKNKVFLTAANPHGMGRLAGCLQHS